MPERVVKTGSFEQDVETLLPDPNLRDVILGILEEKLLRWAEFGARVRGTARMRIWPIFPNDGFVYIAYYSVEGGDAVLHRLRKRPTPLSPQLLDLED